MSTEFEMNDLEKDNLEVHVGLCSMRFKTLDNRLTKVEEDLKQIREDIRNGNSSLIKVIVGTTGTIVASVLGLVVALLMKS